MITKIWQWLRMAVPGMAILLLTGCGGGSSGSTPPPVTYAVSATAGSGGGISPGSATVDAGGTASFTVTPNSGYAVNGVTGCGGMLTGNTYTTGAVSANCTVTASFVAQYTVTSMAGTGGTASPASTTVNSGGTVTFTVTPNTGYVISGVTGCGGTLSGNSYITATIGANCAVTASFSAAFTWVGGSNTADAGGDYGSQGVAAASNVPSARHSPATWTDAAGNLWLLGGYGVGHVGAPNFNDLWKYSPASGEWTWVSGSSTANAIGNYGVLGTAAATNVPGAHGSSLSWTDASGNLWMFGGYGYDSTGAQGWLNSLWEYAPATGMWTWVGGSETVNAIGVYGTKGVPAATNIPGARAGGAGPGSLLRAPGNVWLFGGYGYDSTGSLGSLNDLWEYSTTSGEWTWVAGPDTANANAVYGTQGVPAAANVPPPGVILGWTDANGNLWAFGGNGPAATGAAGYLNDLWEYSSGEWTWVDGSATANARGVYGTQGVAAATNMPGARDDEAYWTDASGNLWLFGGYGYDSAGALGELNDVWKYSPATAMWTWVAGSDTANANGVYGTLGVAAAANIPGAREVTATWVENGDVWLFGGWVYNSPSWNDLWKYPTQ